MKTFLSIVAALLLTAGGAFAQDLVDYSQPVKVDYGPAVKAACWQMANSFSNSYVPTQFQVDGQTQLKPIFSFQLLIKNLRAINIDACPSDFRVAWVNVLHAVENFNFPDDAGTHEAGAVIWGSLAAITKSTAAADQAVSDHAKPSTLDESWKPIKLAIQQLETVAVKY